MKNLTLENITKVCNGIYHGPQEKLQEEVTAITTDSRKVEKGGLFVPVVGERVAVSYTHLDVYKRQE